MCVRIGGRRGRIRVRASVRSSIGCGGLAVGCRWLARGRWRRLRGRSDFGLLVDPDGVEFGVDAADVSAPHDGFACSAAAIA